MDEVSNIDKQKLKNLALMGASSEELLHELDIADGMVLSAALLELLRSEKEIDEDRAGTSDEGLVEHSAMNPRYGPEGINVTPAMLKGTEFRGGDEFGLSIEDDCIILDKSAVGSVGPL